MSFEASIPHDWRCAICKLASDPFKGFTYGAKKKPRFKGHAPDERYLHLFHTRCIKRWEKIYHNCPICANPRLAKFAIIKIQHAEDHKEDDNEDDDDKELAPSQHPLRETGSRNKRVCVADSSAIKKISIATAVAGVALAIAYVHNSVAAAAAAAYANT